MAKRILLFFHNLNMEGAPTMLVNVAKILTEEGYSVEALSLKDGVYEAELKRLKIPIRILEKGINASDGEMDNYIRQFNLVIANTVMAFSLLERYTNTIPIMWYIHEGKIIKNIFSKDIAILESLIKSKANIVVVSEYVKEWLEREYGVKNIAVLHNFIEMDKENVSISMERDSVNKKVHFTYLGSIDGHKGLDILLEANHRLDDRSNVHINYAGNILSKPFYDNIISRYKEDNVQYWGLVSGAEKAALFQQTDVFVVPSRDESCSLVVLEAFAAQKPVIISDQVGAKYLLTDQSGWIFDINCVDELRDLLTDIVNQKYDLSKFGKAAKKQYDKYVSKEKYKEELLALVKRCMDKKDVHQFLRCTDCGACRQSCPVSAISQRENEEGFMYPWISYDKCIQCGKCVEVCPVVNPVFTNSPEPKCYAGYTFDDIRLDRSSSGGVFTVLAKHVLGEDGYVSGVIFDEHFKAGHIVSNNPSDVFRMRGSKYVQSDTQNVYREIEQLLKQSKKVLFTGMSCQVAGLKAYLGKQYDNLYCIDIVCHGVPSPGVFRKYLEEEVGLDEVRDVQFRNKESEGWRKTYIHIDADKWNVFHQALGENAYAAAFLNDVINRNCCADCQFQKFPRQGDITIGDFWGIEDCDPELDDNKGISVILVNSQKGQRLLENCKKDFVVLREEDLQDAIVKNPNIISSSVPYPDREKFFEYNKRFSVSKSARKVLQGECDVIIMNYWYAKNYGAILTCYALYRVLEKENIDVNLLNYIPNRFRPLYEGSFAQLFANKHMEKTKECFSYGDLLSLNDSANTFIVGSDQVWNYNIYQEHGGNIFQLDFTAPEKRRIACAVSFGSDRWNASEYETDKFRELIRDFHAISVREESGKKILKDCFQVEADVIGDPVFALSAEEWKELGGKQPLCINKYFTYYVLAGGHADEKIPWIQDVLHMAEERAGVAPFGLEFGKGYTVEQWINYIANAELVVTDSFHAACFSVIFNRPFIYLLKNAELYPRLENIFEHYKINATVVTENNYREILKERELFDVDFEYANKQIKKDGRLFRDWLVSSINTDVKPIQNKFIRELLMRMHKDELESVLLEKNLEDLRRHNSQLEKNANELRSAYEEVTNSTIWRLTKPIRNILDRVKR